MPPTSLQPLLALQGSLLNATPVSTSTGYFPPMLIRSPSVRRSTMDYMERMISFCTSQMGLTAEEPLYLQASETALSSRLITSLPSIQLKRQTGSQSNSHIHPSHGMSTSHSMGPLIPLIGCLNGKHWRF